MQLLQTYNDIKAHRLINPELSSLETSVWLHAFSRALISIFIPILLLRLGYEISEVMIYYFLYNLFDVPLNFFARWLTRKIGARLVIIIGSLFSVCFFVSLYVLTGNNWPLLITISLFAAIYDTLYWVAHIYLFMVCSKDNDNISKDLSTLVIVRRLAGIVAPILGAGILIFFNSKILIVVSTIILLFSTWPLFKIKDLEDKPTEPTKKIREFFKDFDTLKDYISTSLFAIHRSVEAVIWPIFIYTLFASIESVAMLPVIISVSAMIFTYFIGNINKSKRTTMIITGSFLIVAVWILRLILDNAIFYYISVSMVGFFAVLISIPLSSDIYEKGEKIETLSASTYRNAFSMGGKLVLYAIIIILLNVFNVSFLTAMSSLLILILLNYFFAVKHKLIPPIEKVKISY